MRRVQMGHQPSRKKTSTNGLLRYSVERLTEIDGFTIQSHQLHISNETPDLQRLGCFGAVGNRWLLSSQSSALQQVQYK